ncbi:MAG: sigma-70 family RNA polymerase sigma factor [Ilumatobacteraceae bacterium]|nr:MAG: sigma-70 family RNA polymerase sigma factor [Actinomycetota bacterium]
MGSQPSLERSEFAGFVREVEPRLLQALVSAYGPRDGREATVDALSWAWEHWDRLGPIDNKLGYLYRVGQSATRRYTSRAIPLSATTSEEAPLVDVDPGLLPALRRLSEQQRTVVVLVHAFGWSQSEVAKLLDITVSTAREHLSRALKHLRDELVVCDAG